jgi:hypothetical protein
VRVHNIKIDSEIKSKEFSFIHMPTAKRPFRLLKSKKKKKTNKRIKHHQSHFHIVCFYFMRRRGGIIRTPPSICVDRTKRFSSSSTHLHLPQYEKLLPNLLVKTKYNKRINAQDVHTFLKTSPPLEK